MEISKNVLIGVLFLVVAYFLLVPTITDYGFGAVFGLILPFPYSMLTMYGVSFILIGLGIMKIIRR
jgi:hypothetical protein